MLERGKISLLHRMARIKSAEERFNPTSPLVLFMVHSLLGLTCGVFQSLLLPQFETSLSLNFSLIFLNNFKFVRRTFRVFQSRKWKNWKNFGWGGGI